MFLIALSTLEARGSLEPVWNGVGTAFWAQLLQNYPLEASRATQTRRKLGQITMAFSARHAAKKTN